MTTSLIDQGTAGGTGVTTINITPGNIGDVVILKAQIVSAGGITVTGVSSSNIAWDAAAIPNTRAVSSSGSQYVLWRGIVTAAGADTITITTSASVAAKTVAMFCQTFNSDLGTAWTIVDSNNFVTSVTANVLPGPSLTATAAGQFAFYYWQGSHATSGGSDPGFTYGNGDNTSGEFGYNLAISGAGTVQPSAAASSAASYSSMGVLLDPVGGGGTTRITVGPNFKWGVRGLISKLPNLKWGVRGLVTKTSNLKWAVSVTVTKTANFKWGVHALVTKTSNLKWGVRALIAKTPNFKWAVQALATKVTVTPNFKFAVRQLVTKTPNFKWSVSAILTKTANFKWPVNKLITKTSNLKWSVNKLITKTPNFKWKVGGRIVYTITFKWRTHSFLTWTKLTTPATDYTELNKPATGYTTLDKPTTTWDEL